MRLLHTSAMLCALVSLAGCGSAPLPASTRVPTRVSVGGAERSVVTVTDLDDVRDVAQSAERVFVATDRGLLVHPASGDPGAVRLTVADGLPSDDVTAVVVTPAGEALVATAQGFARVRFDAGEEASVDVLSAPPVGRVSDLWLDAEGGLWACGERGVAHRGPALDGDAPGRAVAGAAQQAPGAHAASDASPPEGGDAAGASAGGPDWVGFGEPAACTLFAPTAQGDLWVGTSRGAWLVQGDVIREHGVGHGIPEAYVRSLVPAGQGAALALLQGPGDTRIGYYDGARWFAYTLPGFEPEVIGLAAVGSRVVLWVPGHAFALTPGGSAGAVALTPLSRSELRGVRSYRARITPAGAQPAGEPPASQGGRAPSALAEVPPSQPTVDAPSLDLSPLRLAAPDDLYAVIPDAGRVFLADRNRGIVRLAADGEPTTLRSRDLVDDTDLQIAVDASGKTWVMGRGGDLGRMLDGRRIERVAPPGGVTLQALASGPHGAYVLALVDVPAAAEAPAQGAAAEAPAQGAPTTRTLRLYRVSSDGWTAEFERDVTTPTRLVGTPFFAIGSDGRVWAALRVEHESGEGTRPRGLAILDRRRAQVVYHHRGATPEADGEGALSMPDEVDAIDLGMEGYAWLPSLSGAVRLGNSQAVVFGESRGVRGEVVSDLVVGENDRVWLAAAEGMGYYEGSTMEFQLPAVVQHARPNRLAMDRLGHIWGVGRRGVVYYDGARWQVLDEAHGLPTDDLVDVEVDGDGRVWLLARDRLMIFEPPEPSGPIVPEAG